MHEDHTPTIQKSPMIADNTVITVTIPWEEAEKAYQKAVRKEAKRVKLTGFRKGKVPTHIVEKQVGKEYLMHQAVNDLLPTMYSQALAESKKQVIAYPEFKAVTIEWGKDWVIEAHTAERPEIKLGNYKMTIKEGRKQGEAAIKKLEEDKKKAKKSDSGKSDKKTAKKSDADAKADEITDQQKQNIVLENVLKALTKDIKPAIPEILVKQQAHQEFHRLEKQLDQMRLDMNQYLERRGVSQDELLQELAASSLAQLQTDFILGKISQEENLIITDDEVDAFLKDKSEKATPDMKNMVRSSLQRQKLVTFLVGEDASTSSSTSKKTKKQKNTKK